jgi:hypothetical protein
MKRHPGKCQNDKKVHEIDVNEIDQSKSPLSANQDRRQVNIMSGKELVLIMCLSFLVMSQNFEEISITFATEPFDNPQCSFIPEGIRAFLRASILPLVKQRLETRMRTQIITNRYFVGDKCEGLPWILMKNTELCMQLT